MVILVSRLLLAILYLFKVYSHLENQMTKTLQLSSCKHIFKHFIFAKGLWAHPDSTKRQLCPKEEGQGIIISSFCCCDLGHDYSLPKSVLDAAVSTLRENQAYFLRKQSLLTMVQNGKINLQDLCLYEDLTMVKTCCNLISKHDTSIRRQ